MDATLFHVFTEDPEGATVDQLGSVRRAAERLTEAGIGVAHAASSGGPVAEILNRAETADVDLTRVAGRKRAAAGKLPFGSVSRSVMLESERPVLPCTESGDDAED